MFLWKCQSFWDRKCLDLRGTRTPNLLIHAECSNLLSYQGQTFAVPCFEHWLWRYRYFLSKVNIWNVNCVRGQQHSFSTHVRVFLWKCQSFWDRKCLELRGTRTPNLLINAQCSNLLSYQGQTFAVPCFELWLWWYRYFWSKVKIWNVNCARVTALIFDTRMGVLVKVSKFFETENVIVIIVHEKFSRKYIYLKKLQMIQNKSNRKLLSVC